MRRACLAAVLLVACSGGATEVSSTTTSVPATTTTTVAVTSSTTPPRDCPRAPYELSALPEGVGQGDFDSSTEEPDVWTSVAGSNTTFLTRSDGTVAIALIRGTLPAVDWPGERGEVSIDGTRAVAGPHPDGTWVVGWFEEPRERCDQYSMIFYPPWSPSDVEQVLAGMDRVGG